MNSFETTAEVQLRSRNDRRRLMVSSIRRWLTTAYFCGLAIAADCVLPYLLAN